VVLNKVRLLRREFPGTADLAGRKLVSIYVPQRITLGVGVPDRLAAERCITRRGRRADSSTAIAGEESTPRGSAAVNPAVKDVFILMASPLVRRLLRVAFVLMVARALGPAGFGVYALIFAVVELLAVISGVGYAEYLTRETAKDERTGWGLAFQLTLLRIGIVIPVAAIVVGILWIMHYHRPVLAGVAWMALTIAPRALSEGVQGVLRGIRRYASYFILDLAVSLTLAAGGCFLLVTGGQLKAVIVAEIAAAVVGGGVALAVCLRFRTVARVGLAWGELVRKTLVFNLYPFTSNLYDRVDVVLLSKLAGDYVTGVYSVAYRALGTLQLIPYSVLYSVLPSLSRNHWGDVEKDRLERAMGLLLIVAFAIVLATFVVAAPAVRLLLGPRYVESVPILKILIWATIPMYINFGLNVALLAMGRERIFLITSAVCLAVNFIGNLLLIPMFSWRGAAVLTILTELLLLAQNVYWVRQAIGRIAIPWGLGRNSLVFAALLAAMLYLGRLISAPVAGIACFLSFLAYLYRAGMMMEFGTIWRSGRSPSA
jgi:O-antigen/teichoic acid export membrane protein